MRKFDNIKIPERQKIKLSKEDKLKIKEQKKIKRQEKKDFKKAKNSIYKYILEVLPILDFDEKGRIITKDGYMDIYQIHTTDIYSFNEYEANLHIFTLIAFLRNYTNDFKLIGMNFPVDTSIQQEYVKRKINESKNETHKVFLKKKLEELAFLEQYRTNREYYLMIFLDNEKKHLMENIIKNQTKIFCIKPIDIDKKVKILFKLNNLNSKII